jgi:hypothetical protein
VNQYVGINWRHWAASTCPLPAPFALKNAFHGTPAVVRAKALQRRSPLTREFLVAARPVATGIEKTPE